MKYLALAILLVAPLTLAQQIEAPVDHLDSSRNPNSHPLGGSPKLIYYAGDVNADDPNVYAFANGNTLMVPNTQTYACVNPGSGVRVIATGMVFNQVASLQTGTVFDPATATYDVRLNVEFDGGQSAASGSAPQTTTPTGRMPFGYTEYATVITFTKPLTARQLNYWLNLTSQCTDSSNANCSNVEFFVDNTTQQTNSINGDAGCPGSSYVNSAFFGYNWVNWCALTQNDQQCNLVSWGVYGTIGRE